LVESLSECFLSAGEDEISFDPDDIIENIEMVQPLLLLVE
jgi:hypothetical protein